MNTTVTLAAGYALASAVGFAISMSLQHRATRDAPGTGPAALLRFLLRQPMWLLGALMGFVTLVLHALALNAGSLALVQPIVISGVVLAVIFRAALDRTVPAGRELGAVIVTTTALAVFLVIADPTAEQSSNESRALVFWIVGLGAVGSLVAAARRSGNAGPRRHRSAFLLGVASGFCFGMTAGFLKLMSHDFGDGGALGVLTAWHLYAQVSTGLLGIAINQHAFQMAPLALSMPALNVVNVLVALAFGVLVFAEVPARDPIALAVLGACLLAIGFGLRMLVDASPTTAGADREDARREIGSST
ncbi:MAG: DMT family transporter [Nocardioides sp.]